MSCETERMDRGYSSEAWEARRSDLQQHFEAFLAGKEIAESDGDKLASQLFKVRAIAAILEIVDSYPKHNIGALMESGGTDGI